MFFVVKIVITTIIHTGNRRTADESIEEDPPPPQPHTLMRKYRKNTASVRQSVVLYFAPTPHTFVTIPTHFSGRIVMDCVSSRRTVTASPKTL